MTKSSGLRGEQVALCKNCLLPDIVTGADLDENGLCAYCRDYDPARAQADDREARQAYRADLEAALAAALATMPWSVSAAARTACICSTN